MRGIGFLLSLPLGLLFLVFFWISLRILSFRKVMALLPQSCLVRSSVVPLNIVVRSVYGIGRRIPPLSNCLVRGLSLYSLGMLLGHRLRVQIGVQLDQNDPFSAHAWVEDNTGKLIGESSESVEKFTRLYTISGIESSDSKSNTSPEGATL